MTFSDADNRKLLLAYLREKGEWINEELIDEFIRERAEKRATR